MAHTIHTKKSGEHVTLSESIREIAPYVWYVDGKTVRGGWRIGEGQAIAVISDECYQGIEPYGELVLVEPVFPTEKEAYEHLVAALLEGYEPKEEAHKSSFFNG